MLKLFYFFGGYLWIRVSGVGASRFINLCGIRHMMLWDIKKDGDSYTMCISLKSFFEMKDIVRKTSTRVVILKRIGLPFLLPGVKKRWFFPAFLVVAAVLFLLSQLLLWNIHIQGNETISEESILIFLEGYEVKKGVLLKNVDTELLEKEMRKTFPSITWISVYLEGNSLTLHMKENDKPIPEENDEQERQHKEGFLEEEKGMDICANKAGVVVSIVTRTGTPAVQVGDEVQVGDVLIRGSVEIFDNEGNVRERVNVHADGDIMLECNIRTSFDVPLIKIVETETGNSKRYTFCRFGDSYRVWHLFSVPYEEYRAHPQAYFHTGDKLGLTFEIGEMEVREIIKVRKEKEEREYSEELSEKMEEYERTLAEKAIQIKGKNVKIEKNADTVVLTGVLKVQGPFFERKETEISEESSQESLDTVDE